PIQANRGERIMGRIHTIITSMSAWITYPVMILRLLGSFILPLHEARSEPALRLYDAAVRANVSRTCNRFSKFMLMETLDRIQRRRFGLFKRYTVLSPMVWSDPTRGRHC